MPIGKILPTVLNDTGLAVSTNAKQHPPLLDNAAFTRDAVLGAGAVVTGTHSPVIPLPIVGQTLTGKKLDSYTALFYNRMDVSPPSIDVGNMTADQQVTLSVFNGFFASKSLDDILENNLDGVTLTGDATPRILGPLEEVLYTVDVFLNDGPPSIDGDYVFDFEIPIPDITVPVIGNRVLPFPYLLQAGSLESVVFNTNIIISNNGYEQRIKVRRAPRQEFEVSLAIPFGELAFLDALLYGWRTNKFGLPISSEARGLINATSTSSPNIDVNTDFADFRVGGLVMIYSSPKINELAEIVSFTTNQIVTTKNITRVYNLGRTLVMPVRIARMLSNPTRLSDGKNVRVNATFETTDNEVVTSSPSVEQYKGLDVYLEEPLLLGRYLNDIYTRRNDVLDFGTGVVATSSPWLKTKTQRTFGLQHTTQEETWNFRKWLHRRSGRQRAFWMPSFENNFNILSVGALDVQIIVKDENHGNLLEERKDLAIQHTTGWIFKEIISITTIGNDLAVNVDTGIGIDASLVTGLFLMGRKRLNSDKIEINWENNGHSSVSLPIIEINN